MDEEEKKLKIYFNPFAFTIEQNNEFLARGWEPIPMQLPETKRMRDPNGGWSAN